MEKLFLLALLTPLLQVVDRALMQAMLHDIVFTADEIVDGRAAFLNGS